MISQGIVAVTVLSKWNCRRAAVPNNPFAGAEERWEGKQLVRAASARDRPSVRRTMLFMIVTSNKC